MSALLPLPRIREARALFSLFPVLGGEGWGEGPIARRIEPLSIDNITRPLSPDLSPDYRGEGVR